MVYSECFAGKKILICCGLFAVKRNENDKILYMQQEGAEAQAVLCRWQLCQATLIPGVRVYGREHLVLIPGVLWGGTFSGDLIVGRDPLDTLLGLRGGEGILKGREPCGGSVSSVWKLLLLLSSVHLPKPMLYPIPKPGRWEDTCQRSRDCFGKCNIAHIVSQRLAAGVQTCT